MPLDLFDSEDEQQPQRYRNYPLIISDTNEMIKHYNLKYEFEKLGIYFELAYVLAAHRITDPTPIYLAAIPALYKASALVISPTGTGKTLAYLLPAIYDLIRNPYPFHTVILAPTRELAQQIRDQFMIFSGPFGLYASLVTGGQSVIYSAQYLASEPYCLIATPGRLFFAMQTQDDRIKSMFARCKFVILDEADMFLDADFDKELSGVLSQLTGAQRTVLATASDTATLLELARLKSIYIVRSPQPKMPENITHYFYILPQNFQAATYAAYFISCLTGIDVINKNDGHPMNYERRNTAVRQGIVFAEGAEQCEVLTRTFNQLQMSAVGLHGKMRYDDRWAAIQRFKLGNVLLLVATDLAARGLDIYTVDFVVHMGVCDPVMYLHRTGRAGRSGAVGISYMLVKPQQILLKEAIEAADNIVMQYYRQYHNYCWGGKIEHFSEQFMLREAFYRVARFEVQAKMDVQMENVGERLRRKRVFTRD